MTMKDNNNSNINENNEHETPTITTKIGSTTYVVGLHFSKTKMKYVDLYKKQCKIKDFKCL